MELQIFKNDAFGEVRTLLIDNEPYFVGKDVAEVLGYKDTGQSIRKHVDDEDKLTRQIDASGQRRNQIMINESGLYSLILKSKLPTAKQFKRWVTSEVLPTIRKHGVYATDELLDNPDFLIEALQKLKVERELRLKHEATIEEQKPKVLFADAVSASHTSILVGDLAKLLRQNGINIGQNRLFQWLRNTGYLIKRKGESWNCPTQYSMELGLFEVKERTYQEPDGSVKITRTTKVTGKGQQFFINKFLREGVVI